MLEVQSESKAMMSKMFAGRQPELGIGLTSLVNTQEIENIEAMARLLPESERVYMSALAKNLPLLLESVIYALGEEAAAAFLLKAFGFPEQEIADLATPVYLDLLSKLNLADETTWEKIYNAQGSLKSVVDGIGRSIVTLYALRLEELKSKRERFVASQQKLGKAETSGITTEKGVEKLDGIHGDELVTIDAEIWAAELSIEHWFELAASLEEKQSALGAIQIPDPAAIRETLVFSGSAPASY